MIFKKLTERTVPGVMLFLLKTKESVATNGKKYIITLHDTSRGLEPSYDGDRSRS